MAVIADNVVAIRRLTIDNVTWTAVAAPKDCNGLSVKQSDGTNDILVRTVDTDATTEDTILNAYSWVLPTSGQGSISRIRAGDVVCYLKSVAGTGPAVITYMR